MRRAVALFFICLLGVNTPALGAIFVWVDTTTGGDLNNTSNWAPQSSIGAGDSLTLDQSGNTGSASVSASSDFTFGSVALTAPASGLMVNGPGTVNFDNSGSPSSLSLSGGNSVGINAGIDLKNGVDVSGNGSVTFNDVTQSAGAGITLTNSSIGVNINGNASGVSVNVQQGGIDITGGSLGTLTIDNTAQTNALSSTGGGSINTVMPPSGSFDYGVDVSSGQTLNVNVIDGFLTKEGAGRMNVSMNAAAGAIGVASGTLGVTGNLSSTDTSVDPGATVNVGDGNTIRDNFMASASGLGASILILGSEASANGVFSFGDNLAPIQIEVNVDARGTVSTVNPGSAMEYRPLSGATLDVSNLIVGNDVSSTKTGSGTLQIGGGSAGNANSRLVVTDGTAIMNGAADFEVEVQGGRDVMFKIGTGGSLNNTVFANGGTTEFGNGIFADGFESGDTLAWSSVGESPGSATTGSATWDSGLTYIWDVNKADGTAGADPGWDLWNINSTLTIAATGAEPMNLEITSLGLDNNPGTLAVGASIVYTWVIADAGTISGFDANAFTFDTANFSSSVGGSFDISYSAVNETLSLQFTTVPEPAMSRLFIGLAVSLTLLARKRRPFLRP